MSANKSEDSTGEDSDSLPEPLLLFAEAFNFKKFVEDCVIPSEESEISDIVQSSSHLVGQTRNGEILFAWDRRNGEDAIVTNVGLFAHHMQTHQIIYQHDCRADICNASVNAEKTLLAFTVREGAYEVDENAYDSFIAEIQPQGRIFSLNICSPDFRMHQFLHIDQHSPKNRLTSKATHSSHLLVVIPRVIICLYHFKLQGTQKVVMTDHPKQEIIHRNFSWYQWDPLTQWLYYASFEATSTKVSMSMSGGKHTLLLNCENFSTINHQLLFTVSLPLLYSEQFYNDGCTYYNDPFAFALPVREMNLQVLYRRDGFWCACLQHCMGMALDQHYTDNGSNEGGKIDYSIYIIHNGYVLYGKVPLPQLTSTSMYIYFFLIGCFVAAYIPDVMLHLLNVGPRVDPCHHLTFGSDYSSFAVSDTGLVTAESPDSEGDSSNGSSTTLDPSPCLAFAMSRSLLGDYNNAVLDCVTNIIYECNLSTPAFFELFKTSTDPVLKKDLLHLMVVGFRHHGMALSMIEHVCQTPMTICDHKLFAEFIISSCFANVHFDCKKFFARQLPLTTTPTFHGKVFKSPDGGSRALLKLTQIPNFVKQLLVQSDQRLVMATAEELLNYDPPGTQAFENLCFNAILSQPKYTRIDIKKLPGLDEHQCVADSPSSGNSRQQKGNRKVGSQHHSTSGTNTTGGGILNKIATFGRKSGNYTSPVSPGQKSLDMLTFLTNDSDISDQLAAKATTVREQLVMSLTQGLPLRSKNIAYNTVATYYSELEKQSCNLLLVIWQSLGFNSDNHPLKSTVCRSPTAKEHILYELLEAYQLAHIELGLPLPIGFQTLFISMGYLCLEKMLFLQCLRNRVFTPTKKFVEILLEDCDEEDAKIVFQVFCNIDYSLAEFALERWHDPTIKQLEQPTQRTERAGHGLL